LRRRLPARAILVVTRNEGKSRGEQLPTRSVAAPGKRFPAVERFLGPLLAPQGAEQGAWAPLRERDPVFFLQARPFPAHSATAAKRSRDAFAVMILIASAAAMAERLRVAVQSFRQQFSSPVLLRGISLQPFLFRRILFRSVLVQRMILPRIVFHAIQLRKA